MAGVETFTLRQPKALRPDGKGVLNGFVGDLTSFSECRDKNVNVAPMQTLSVFQEQKKKKVDQRHNFHTWSRLKPLPHFLCRCMETCIFPLCKDYIGHLKTRRHWLLQLYVGRISIAVFNTLQQRVPLNRLALFLLLSCSTKLNTISICMCVNETFPK